MNRFVMIFTGDEYTYPCAVAIPVLGESLEQLAQDWLKAKEADNLHGVYDFKGTLFNRKDQAEFLTLDEWYEQAE